MDEKHLPYISTPPLTLVLKCAEAKTASQNDQKDAQQEDIQATTFDFTLVHSTA